MTLFIQFLTLIFILNTIDNAESFKHHTFGKPDVSKDILLPNEEWFEQTLDHFNPTNNGKWKQRFFRNEKFYKSEKSGPVFLMIGGEGEASPEWMVAGTWIEYAKQLNALCFQLEHRYYGKSWPVENMSTKNMVYLSSQQALADLANFIVSMNEKYNFDSNVKWIVFGGSYPGSLAAWMRLKYPHLVSAAMSASGPLLAKADFMEYYNVVTDALRTIGDTCVDELKLSMKQLRMLMQHRVGQRSVTKKFKLCDSIEGAPAIDVSSFYENIADIFAGVVQYNKDNRIGKSAKLKNVTIDLVCNLITDKQAGTPLDRLSNINSLMLGISDQKCMDYKYDKMIDSLRNSEWNSTENEGGRPWMYQTCNEFGFYQTSSGVQDIFQDYFPLQYFVQQCADIFGPKFNSSYINDVVRRSNTMYGGLDIQVSKVVFVHGSIDPWHALGIIKSENPLAPAIYIKGTAHCANMYPASDDDLPSLKDARSHVFKLINEWITM